MNIDKLKALCRKHTVEVSFNGLPFRHKVINAERLLEELHTTTDVEEGAFIENINAGYFMTPEYESIFRSIKTVGMFRTKGAEALDGAKAYIECRSLDWL